MPTNVWNRYLDTTNYDCVRVEKGYLKLTAKRGPGETNTNNYKTGGVWSLNNRYGIGTSLKVRAKLYQKDQTNKFYVPSAFPAIWYNELLSDWPIKGEIDLMEWVNSSSNKVHSTVHYKNSGSNASTSSNTVLNDVYDWHTYRCDLYSNNVVIYIDTNEVFRYTNNGSNPYPFNTNYYNIILNASLQNQIKGTSTWGAAVETNQEGLPYEMWVDWVEVSLIDKGTGKPITNK